MKSVWSGKYNRGPTSKDTGFPLLFTSVWSGKYNRGPTSKGTGFPIQVFDLENTSEVLPQKA